MLRVPASRRTAAVLMAAMVAVLLVALGGARHTPAQRTVVETRHSVAAAHAARTTQVTPGTHQHQAQHLDLASTAPDAGLPPVALTTYVEQLAPGSPVVTDLPAPIGRGPPAS